MNRRTTNAIRLVLDELLPPFIRDSKVFMYPLYVFAYGKLDVRREMAFKELVQVWSSAEYQDFYRSLTSSISRRRVTDLNTPSVTRILAELADATTVLDVGCGNGWLLGKIDERRPKTALFGVDVVDAPRITGNYRYARALVEQLPFQDDAFDVVVCTHTLEHLLDVERAVAELTRVARHKLIVVVPRQRPYRYTLDEHVNFFRHRYELVNAIGLSEFRCDNVSGDWVYVGRPEPTATSSPRSP
jgi:ubiquinone/menaquinone biosynthesis C-methylase UbiE